MLTINYFAWVLAAQAVISFLAFPSELIHQAHPALAWLVFLVPLPFFWICLVFSPRQALVRGGLSGLAMYWPPSVFITQISYYPIVGWLVWLLVGLLTFGLTGGIAWLVAKLRTDGQGWVLLYGPAALTGLDFLRLVGAPHFWLIPTPAALLAYPLAVYPPLIQMASLTGILGPTAWIFFMAGIMAWWTLPWVSRETGLEKRAGFSAPWRTLAALVLAVGVFFMAGNRDAWRTAQEQTAAKQTLAAALLQPNFDPAAIREWNRGVQGRTLRFYAKMIGDAAAQKAELVVFPENAIPGTLPEDHLLWEGFRSLFKDYRMPAVIGLVTNFSQDIAQNMYYWVTGEGLIEDHYAKQYLAPFGEYLPMRPFFTLMTIVVNTVTRGNFSFQKLTALGADTQDLTPGRIDKVFSLGEKKFMIKICDELLYPGYFRSGIRLGAQAILSPATGNWFISPVYLYHYLLAAQYRAVETRRWVGRTVNLSSAFFIDARGQVRQITPFHTQAVALARMPLLQHISFYVRWGEWVGWLMAAICGAGLARVGWRTWVEKRRRMG